MAVTPVAPAEVEMPQGTVLGVAAPQAQVIGVAPVQPQQPATIQTLVNGDLKREQPPSWLGLAFIGIILFVLVVFAATSSFDSPFSLVPFFAIVVMGMIFSLSSQFRGHTITLRGTDLTIETKGIIGVLLRCPSQTTARAITDIAAVEIRWIRGKRDNKMVFITFIDIHRKKIIGTVFQRTFSLADAEAEAQFWVHTLNARGARVNYIPPQQDSCLCCV